MPVLKIAAAIGCAAVVCFGPALSASASSAGLKKIHDPRHVTYSIHITSCHTRDRRQLPDRSCTPGSIDPKVTQRDIRSTICRAGWTARVRPPESQTERAKYRVAYPAYHVRHGTKSELDHLVPLELGGSNDITNLWPEIGRIPNPKDAVENALNRAVCEGRVKLAAAQKAIATDWLTAEKRLGLRGRGHRRRHSAWCRARAAYNPTYSDYDVYVHSNQPHRTATATASNGASWSYETNGSGYADIYLYANAGDAITVTVGPATCHTTA